MSNEAMGFVFKRSPYRGAPFQVHLALADSANDMNDNEIWAKQEWIAAKARVARQTANAALAELVSAGFLTVLEDNARAGRPNRYRFEMPDVAVVFDGVSATATPHSSKGVTRDDTGVSATTTQGVTRDDTGVSATTTQGVTRDDTEPNRTQREPNASVVDATLLDALDDRRVKRRRRDLLFEAVAEVCKLRLDALTKTARGQLNKATRELRDLDVTAPQVRAAARAYRRKYGDRVVLTPMSLVKHWPQLVGEREQASVADNGWVES